MHMRVHVDLHAGSRTASGHKGSLRVWQGANICLRSCLQEWKYTPVWACWSAGHTSVQGHRSGRGPSYQPCTCTHIFVAVRVCVMPAGQLKNRAVWIAIARDSIRTHDRRSNSNSCWLSLNFVMTDEWRGGVEKARLSHGTLSEMSAITEEGWRRQGGFTMCRLGAVCRVSKGQ